MPEQGERHRRLIQNGIPVNGRDQAKRKRDQQGNQQCHAAQPHCHGQAVQHQLHCGFTMAVGHAEISLYCPDEIFAVLHNKRFVQPESLPKLKNFLIRSVRGSHQPGRITAQTR